jgi:hypothetical protein
MIGRAISLTEAVKLERQRVFRKFETRMQITIELARRGAVRRGRMNSMQLLRINKSLSCSKRSSTKAPAPVLAGSS